MAYHRILKITGRRIRVIITSAKPIAIGCAQLNVNLAIELFLKASKTYALGMNKLPSSSL